MKYKNQLQLIIDLRAKHSLSQGDLAKAIGANVQAVSQWERGVVQIPLKRAAIMIKKGLVSYRAFESAALQDYERELKDLLK